MEELICKYCGKICKNKNSLRNHERMCPKNENRKYISYTKGKPAWNRGLTKENNESIRKQANTLKRRILSGEVIPSNLGRQRSEEEKLNLSTKRREYLKEHPDKIPYLLNHSSKESYPEKYFCNVFSNDERFIGFEREYRVNLYSLDFAYPDIKLDIEIDGEQHYVDKNIVKHDIERTNTLLELGWSVLRIRWSEFRRLNEKEKHQYIDSIYSKIESYKNKDL